MRKKESKESIIVKRKEKGGKDRKEMIEVVMIKLDDRVRRNNISKIIEVKGKLKIMKNREKRYSKIIVVLE